MLNSKLKSVFSFFVFLAVLLGVADSASAQSSSLEAQQQSAVSTPVVTSQSSDLILFSQFLKEDIYLTGPFDSNNVYFSLPTSWSLTSGAQLNLSMSITFSQSTQGAASGVPQGSGNITVTLNNVFVGLVPVETSGKTTFQLDIPQEALLAEKEDGLYKLQFSLRSTGTCQFDENTLIVIHTDSSMNLPHTSMAPDTNLVNFPAQIFQNSAAITTPVLVVIPDHPSAAELQSAMTIAAGLGNISSSKLAMDLNLVSHLTPEQIANNNLILIGKAGSQVISDQLKLPLPVTGNAFSNPGGNIDDGIIELMNSPWNGDKVVLVVSGNTEAATLKSAQAVSTGVLRPNVYPNVAIVDAVKPAPIPVTPRVDQTLGDMGYGGGQLKDIGVNNVTYYFYIPPSKVVTEDAYFELEYGHSSLVQYDRAGIVVSINGKPVGSVSFTKDTASQAVNKVRFSLPASAVLAGTNELQVKVNLIPVDVCSNPDFDGVYANIWPESNLHLPIRDALVNPTAAIYDLIAYPAPFTYASTLDSTALILERDNLASWREAFQVAAFLGDRSDGAVTMLSTFYADELPENERSKYNFIAIGGISKLPILNEINKFLPAPFDFGQKLANEPEMQVKYRINPNAAVGYVELLSSPWNSDKVFLAAVGNDAQGITWAASHLIAPLSYKLSGNFSVINDQRVYTADTRLALLTPGAITPAQTQTSILEIAPPAIGNPDASTPYRPGWILPALILSIVMIIITVVIAIYINRLQNHSGPPKMVQPETKDE